MERIKKLLREIEDNNSIIILYACLMGSRVYGYNREDSDYDIRFVYIHKNYFDIRIKKDTYNIVIDNYEFVGWELKKALTLLSNSNVAIGEWLHSPEIYINDYHSDLLEAYDEYYSSNNAAYHYINMARNEYTKLTKGLINGLREILCYRYIRDNPNKFPPIKICDLLYLLPTSLYEECDKLLEKRIFSEDIYSYVDKFTDRIEKLDEIINYTLVNKLYRDIIMNYITN